jgi:hypothetical protein
MGQVLPPWRIGKTWEPKVGRLWPCQRAYGMNADLDWQNMWIVLQEDVLVTHGPPSPDEDSGAPLDYTRVEKRGRQHWRYEEVWEYIRVQVISTFSVDD